MKRVLFVLFFAASLIIDAQVQSRFINVTGTAELIVPAEQISFSLNIKTVKDSMEECKKLNDKAVENLITALTGIGIAKDDIEIAPISLGRNYVFEQSGRKEKGFYANVNIVFKFKDLSKYYFLTEKLSKSPFVEVEHASYEITKTRFEELNKDLNKKALLAAKDKAEYMSATLGMKLGNVLEIEGSNDVRQNSPNPFNVSQKLDYGNGASGNEVISGKVTLNKSVRVKFELLVSLQ